MAGPGKNLHIYLVQRCTTVHKRVAKVGEAAVSTDDVCARAPPQLFHSTKGRNQACEIINVKSVRNHKCATHTHTHTWVS